MDAISPASKNTHDPSSGCAIEADRFSVAPKIELAWAQRQSLRRLRTPQLSFYEPLAANNPRWQGLLVRRTSLEKTIVARAETVEQVEDLADLLNRAELQEAQRRGRAHFTSPF